MRSSKSPRSEQGGSCSFPRVKTQTGSQQGLGRGCSELLAPCTAWKTLLRAEKWPRFLLRRGWFPSLLPFPPPLLEALRNKCCFIADNLPAAQRLPCNAGLQMFSISQKSNRKVPVPLAHQLTWLGESRLAAFSCLSQADPNPAEPWGLLVLSCWGVQGLGRAG